MKYVGLIIFVALLLPKTSAAAEGEYFKIQVVDSTTGRGVPMVELRTTANHYFITDSNGSIAFHEPGLMDQEVFFHIRAHGYEFPKDGFGYAGTRVEVVPGGSVLLKIVRVNAAERLYRVTGYGIYRDTVLLGETAPIAEPLLNARVTGSDSVQMERFGGRLHWFWGDTHRPRYPLGTFHTPGATSPLPGQGGLDPDVGIDLTYFVDDDGFASGTARMGDQGFTWMSGLVAFVDSAGRERMFGHFVRGVPDERAMWRILERGIMEWNSGSNRFVRAGTWRMDGSFPDGAHSFLHDSYIYFADPFPRWRVPADPAAVVDQRQYEAYSCLPMGTRDIRSSSVAEDAGLEFGWKPNTATLGYGELTRLVRDGRIEVDEYPWHIRDSATGEALRPHRGSMAWNAHRNRWIMIFGISPDLGQIYFAESDHLIDGWSEATQVVTHNNYSFYNPVHHPELDQDGGRVIYFEGTYTQSFSGAPVKTPLYDYNQIMYRLDLATFR